MSRKVNPLTLVTIALLLVLPMFAQIAVTPSRQATPSSLTAEDEALLDFAAWFAPGGSSLPVTGHSYSTQLVMEIAQNRPDGSHVNHKLQEWMAYRDSKGRTRFNEVGNPDEPTVIVVVDPIAGYQYTLLPSTKVARRAPFKEQTKGNVKSKASESASLPGPVTGPDPQTSTESLGTQLMEGIAVEGTRTTTVYPEGFKGVEKSITSVHDSWRSSDLQIVLLSTISKPLTGDIVMLKVEKISLAEPDSSLFQVPAAYRIVDVSPNAFRSAPEP